MAFIRSIFAGSADTVLSYKLLIRSLKLIIVDEFQIHFPCVTQPFLFCEPGVTSEEIAAACGLEIPEVEAINSLINDFAIMSEFYHPSELNSQAVRYSKIASVEKCQEGFIIEYFSPAYARGRYIIDHNRFERLLSDGQFTAREAKEARQLLQKLHLINTRKDTINNLLQGLIRIFLHIL